MRGSVEARRRVAAVARLWGELTLGGVLIITGLVLWHLRRRARLIRERLGRPRPVPSLEVPPGETTPGPAA